MGVAESYMHFVYAEDSLWQKLNELDRLRNGKNTPFEEVEKRGRELLAEYIKPEQQAQIYFHLTEIHGQSGMVNTDLVIQHAQKALALPVEPLQRLRLYVYWGDAIQISDLHKTIKDRKPFYEARRQAARPYLEGLKDAQKYDIPPESPNMPLATLYNEPPNSPQYQQHQKEMKKMADMQQEVRLEQDLWLARKILIGQVVEAYSRKPYAATELRELATKILEDPKEVDALMKLIEEKGALKDDPVPDEKM
ncbi:MAG: hypothetical protein ABSE63_01455 [Thermoguttaceae bacterium]